METIKTDHYTAKLSGGLWTICKGKKIVAWIDIESTRTSTFPFTHVLWSELTQLIEQCKNKLK